jgi:RNA polymerase sigma-70 factor, ECF subfamily
MVARVEAAALAWLPLPRGATSGDATTDVDGDLARASRRGDRDAFGRLVARHERAVYGLCLRLLGQREEARDAAQEAFVRAYESLGSYDPTLAFRPWLLRIARNRCLDLRRRAAVRPATASLEEVAAAADREAVAADERLVRAEGQERLQAAIARLPDDQREALLLFHHDQLSYREIAVVLEAPLGTVMTWLHRARRRLREDLGGEP